MSDGMPVREYLDRLQEGELPTDPRAMTAIWRAIRITTTARKQRAKIEGNDDE